MLIDWSVYDRRKNFIRYEIVARVVTILESEAYQVERKRLIFVVSNDRDRVAVPVITFYKKLILQYAKDPR